MIVKEGDKIVAADIIDFKTDSVTADSINERVEHYRPQLEAYRSAVSRFLNLDSNRIATRLLFVAAGELVTLEENQARSSPESIPQPEPVEETEASETKHKKMKVPKPKYKSEQLKLWQD